MSFPSWKAKSYFTDSVLNVVRKQLNKFPLQTHIQPSTLAYWWCSLSEQAHSYHSASVSFFLRLVYQHFHWEASLQRIIFFLLCHSFTMELHLPAAAILIILRVRYIIFLCDSDPIRELKYSTKLNQSCS